jgi:hypothetical protein
MKNTAINVVPNLEKDLRVAVEVDMRRSQLVLTRYCEVVQGGHSEI